MRTAIGLDILRHEDFARLRGKSIALLCNQASIDHEFDHVIDLLLPHHQAGRLKVAAVFGPEHGLYGHTQDNMIEWEGMPDPRTGLTVHSLYGKHREPTDEMLEGVDLMVVDIPDIGSRYYTFVWTMAYCIKACAERGIPVMVLDRPNPIGGLQVEGTVLQQGFESFVGLHSVPTRHGLTIAEMAEHMRNVYYREAVLSPVAMQGWSRSDYFDDTDCSWAMPSPNMPTVDTAVVYPGGCLLEGTNLSEGRGTTRPFEMFGAPFVDGWKLADALNAVDLPAVKFRPVQFEPTFNKHQGKLCEGCFVHVTDRQGFEPVLTYVAILQEIVRQGGVSEEKVEREATFKAASAETNLDRFAWKQPPYEYEHDRMPFDILAGNDWLRPAIEGLQPLNEVHQRFLEDCHGFEHARREAMLYPTPGT
jgi:uncharacterized protein YbbC (DUF1343 family)